VDMYSYAWVKDPIAHAFVAESGAAFIGAGGNSTSAGQVVSMLAFDHL
jgi:hypothetical protein